MKCSSKSTRSFVSASLWLLVLTAPLHGGLSPSTDRPSALADAIEAAVRARIGTNVVVAVEDIRGLRLSRQTASYVAVPDPSARIGSAVRFVLATGESGARTRIGEVTAVVLASAPA